MWQEGRMYVLFKAYIVDSRVPHGLLELFGHDGTSHILNLHSITIHVRESTSQANIMTVYITVYVRRQILVASVWWQVLSTLVALWHLIHRFNKFLKQM